MFRVVSIFLLCKKIALWYHHHHRHHHHYYVHACLCEEIKKTIMLAIKNWKKTVMFYVMHQIFKLCLICIKHTHSFPKMIMLMMMSLISAGSKKSFKTTLFQTVFFFYFINSLQSKMGRYDVWKYVKWP